MAVFDLGSIRTTMGLDESNFVRGMINAQGAAQIFGQSVTTFVNNPLLGTIGLVKSVGTSIFTAVKEQAFANQELLRSAQRIGTTVELLSALRGSYKGWGQDAEAVQRQLTKLNQQIGESIAGNVAAKANFDALNVSLRDNAGNARSFNDVFFDVVEGLGNLENHSRRVAIAQKLFGEDVSNTIDIIGRGRGVLRDFISESEKLGEVFSEEDVRKSDQMANAFDALERAIAGIKSQLAQGVISGFIGEEFDSSKIADVSKTLKDELLPVAKDLGAALRDIYDSLKKIKDIGQIDILRWALEFSRGRGVSPGWGGVGGGGPGGLPRSDSLPGVPDNSGMSAEDIDRMLDQPRTPGFLRWGRQKDERQTRTLE